MTIKLISVLIDSSGSMDACWQETLDAYDAFLDGIDDTLAVSSIVELNRFSEHEALRNIHKYMPPRMAPRQGKTHELGEVAGGTPLYASIKKQLISLDREAVRWENASGYYPECLLISLTDGGDGSGIHAIDSLDKEIKEIKKNRPNKYQLLHMSIGDTYYQDKRWLTLNDINIPASNSREAYRKAMEATISWQNS